MTTLDTTHFLGLARAIARRDPGLSAETVLYLAEAVYDEVLYLLPGITAAAVAEVKNAGLPDPSVASDLAEWAKGQPGVLALINQDRKIMAIKELRAVWPGAETLGLKQAKNAVDILSMCPHGLSRSLCSTPNGEVRDPHYPPVRADDDYRF